MTNAAEMLKDFYLLVDSLSQFYEANGKKLSDAERGEIENIILLHGSGQQKLNVVSIINLRLGFFDIGDEQVH